MTARTLQISAPPEDENMSQTDYFAHEIMKVHHRVNPWEEHLLQILNVPRPVPEYAEGDLPSLTTEGLCLAQWEIRL